MSEGKAMKDYTAEELVQKARDNHIWLNAMGAINPTDEFLMDIGRAILDKLEHTEMRDDFGISKKIILTINKS